MFNLMLKSTHERRMQVKRDNVKMWVKEATRRLDIIVRVETENIRLKAELAKERNVHTEYWKDSAGRWRHPDKPCKCVKASVVMEAQLRKENEQKLKRKEAQNAYKKVGA